MSAVNSGPAHPGSQVGILTDPFRDNVAGPLQGLLRIFDSEFLVDIRIGSSYIFDGFLFDRSIRLLGHKKICQSFKALFPGRGRSGRPFGPEGLIKIVDGNLGLGLQDLRLQLVGQLALGFDRIQDLLLFVFQCPKRSQAVRQITQLLIV